MITIATAPRIASPDINTATKFCEVDFDTKLIADIKISFVVL